MITKTEFLLSEILWNYHLLNQKLTNSDIIFVLGNSDMNTIKRGVEVYDSGLSKKVVISGGKGKITKNFDIDSEAEMFYNYALKQGIPKSNIILEKESTNTGENYVFTKRLLELKNIEFRSVIIVTKPYMERRAYATAKVHWPEKKIKIASIRLSFHDYLVSIGDFSHVINLMVGDLQRIIEYPKQGFQIPQEVPDNVLQAYERLISIGFNKCLIKC